MISPLHLIKGYNLKLSGRPLPEVEHLPPPRQVAAVAGRLRFVKPRLAVKVGDRVKVGSLLFADKHRPEIQFRSPGGGTVNAVNFGPRRRLQEVVITLDVEEAYEEFPRVSDADLESIGRERLIELVIGGGLWPLIRELPFRDAARPETAAARDIRIPRQPRAVPSAAADLSWTGVGTFWTSACGCSSGLPASRPWSRCAEKMRKALSP